MSPEAADRWEDPFPDIDEDTAQVRRDAATEKLDRVETGEARTEEAINALRSQIVEQRSMHHKNHYTMRLRQIFRASHHAA